MSRKKIYHTSESKGKEEIKALEHKCIKIMKVSTEEQTSGRG
jgi:hypothetical protein